MENNIPYSRGRKISLNFFVLNTQNRLIITNITTSAYPVGVCLDKNPKHNRNGIINHEKNLLFFIPKINEQNDKITNIVEW